MQFILQPFTAMWLKFFKFSFDSLEVQYAKSKHCVETIIELLFVILQM